MSVERSGAAGVEVWFDQNELVGGDAWGQKIRRQIKECALFVPVISAHTQSRREGYFRREWKQAAERTRDMAEGTPFLLPVVIDTRPDRDALVPEEFRAVQWTRVGAGGPFDEFCTVVQNLLAREMGPRTPSSALNPMRRAAAPLPIKPTVARRWRWFAAGGTIAVVLGRQGHRDEAINDLEETCRFESPPQTLGMLANFYGRMGRRADAQRVLEQLLAKSKQRYVPA